jgi:cytosine/adenosine deaminase-related metal-dependent hydrolase
MAYSLRARVVFAVDRAPIEHGVVTIDGERIVAVGPKTQAADATDLGEVVLLPGLVNAHTHLEFNHLRRPLGEPGISLVDWIRLVIAERGRGHRDPSEAIAAGIAESIGCGVTTVGEICQGDTNSYANRDVDLTLLLEVIGFSPARAQSAFAAVLERLEAPEVTPAWKIGLSPHAPYTVSPELLRQLIELSRERGMPVAMHLAESAEELELLASGSGPFRQLLEERGMWDAAAIPRGSRPMDYLRMLAEAPRAVVIHGNYLDEEERTFLVANRDRMSLVYCPRTHAYFAHPPYPLAELLAAGVRIAFGTDSRASNPDLDLMAEMRFVAQTFLGINPLEILHMGTLAGAEALGRSADIGSITPGKLANLVAVPISMDVRDKPADLLAMVLFGSDSPYVVWIRGERMEASRASRSSVRHLEASSHDIVAGE